MSIVRKLLAEGDGVLRSSGLEDTSSTERLILLKHFAEKTELPQNL